MKVVDLFVHTEDEMWRNKVRGRLKFANVINLAEEMLGVFPYVPHPFTRFIRGDRLGEKTPWDVPTISHGVSGGNA